MISEMILGLGVGSWELRVVANMFCIIWDKGDVVRENDEVVGLG